MFSNVYVQPQFFYFFFINMIWLLNNWHNNMYLILFNIYKWGNDSVELGHGWHVTSSSSLSVN